MAKIKGSWLDFSSSCFIVETHAYNYFINVDVYGLSTELAIYACWSDGHETVICYIVALFWWLSQWKITHGVIFSGLIQASAPRLG